MFLVKEEDMLLVPFTAVSDIVFTVLINLVICQSLKFDVSRLCLSLRVDFSCEDIPGGEVTFLVKGNNFIFVLSEAQILFARSHSDEA